MTEKLYAIPVPVDHQADQKWNAPAPHIQLGRVKTSGDDGSGKRASEGGQPLSDHLQRAVKAAPVGRHALDQKARRTRKLASSGEPLEQSGQDHQDRRADSNRAVWWSECHDGNRNRHQQYDQLQGRLAASSIGVEPEDYRTHRPHEEADSKGRERKQ
jgi:hypothetical protein